MNFNLKYFEEAFTTENWIVRIFRVKERGNRDDLEYIDESQATGTNVQSLSWVSTTSDTNKFLKTRTPIKNLI